MVCGYVSQVIEGAATLIGVEDPGTALAMNSFYDDMCCDPSEPGQAIALAFELYNDGLLTKEDTDGLDLTWGNYESYMDLFGKMLRREGLGATLAKGLKEAARALGPEAEKRVVHVQGEGPMQHEIRAWPDAFWMMMVGSLVGVGSTIGAGMGSVPDEDMALPPLDWDDLDASLPGMGEIAWKSGAKKQWDDCHGTCFFSTIWVPGALSYATQAVAAAVGWDDFTTDEALLVGARMQTLLRLMNLYRGYKPEFDLDLSPRLLEPVPNGPNKGQTPAPLLERVRTDFYAAADWDLNTGEPRAPALERVGLENYSVGARS
jgi:aldehyde:ferredoxin oxidoreductase